MEARHYIVRTESLNARQLARAGYSVRGNTRDGWPIVRGPHGSHSKEKLQALLGGEVGSERIVGPMPYKRATEAR